jgi:hypothetical protein
VNSCSTSCTSSSLRLLSSEPFLFSPRGSDGEKAFNGWSKARAHLENKVCSLLLKTDSQTPHLSNREGWTERNLCGGLRGMLADETSANQSAAERRVHNTVRAHHVVVTAICTEAPPDAKRVRLSGAHHGRHRASRQDYSPLAINEPRGKPVHPLQQHPASRVKRFVRLGVAKPWEPSCRTTPYVLGMEVCHEIVVFLVAALSTPILSTSSASVAGA